MVKKTEYKIRDRRLNTVMDRAESDPLTSGLYETSPKAQTGNRMAYTPYSFLRQWLLPSEWLCFVRAAERKDEVFCLQYLTLLEDQLSMQQRSQ